MPLPTLAAVWSLLPVWGTVMLEGRVQVDALAPRNTQYQGISVTTCRWLESACIESIHMVGVNNATDVIAHCTSTPIKSGIDEENWLANEWFGMSILLLVAPAET